MISSLGPWIILVGAGIGALVGLLVSLPGLVRRRPIRRRLLADILLGTHGRPAPQDETAANRSRGDDPTPAPPLLPHPNPARATKTPSAAADGGSVVVWPRPGAASPPPPAPRTATARAGDHAGGFGDRATHRPPTAGDRATPAPPPMGDEAPPLALLPPAPGAAAPPAAWIAHARAAQAAGARHAVIGALAQALDRLARLIATNGAPSGPGELTPGRLPPATLDTALAEILTLAAALPDRPTLARAHALTGRHLDQGDDLEAAHDHHLAALELYESLDDKPGIAAVCEALAMIHVKAEDPAGAEAYWRYALSLLAVAGGPSDEARVLGRLGATALHRNDIAGARDLLTQALGLEERLGHPERAAPLAADLARLEEEAGRPAVALDLWSRTRRLLAEGGLGRSPLARDAETHIARLDRLAP